MCFWKSRKEEMVGDRTVNSATPQQSNTLEHGKWEPVKGFFGFYTWEVQCSLCGTPQDQKSKFCPECGHPMD